MFDPSSLNNNGGFFQNLFSGNGFQSTWNHEPASLNNWNQGQSLPGQNPIQTLPNPQHRFNFQSAQPIGYDPSLNAGPVQLGPMQTRPSFHGYPITAKVAPLPLQYQRGHSPLRFLRGLLG